MNEIAEHTLKQPKVFALSAITSLFERFSFYILAFLLVLYTKEVFNLTDKQAFLLYGVLNALVYLTPAIGGYIADNILGIRRTMVLGMFLEGTGLALVGIPNYLFFLIGSSLVIVGVGFFKICPTNLMARSYEEKDPRIDGGFTLYYMLMNIGGLLAPIAGGFLQKYFGWHLTFLIGAVVLYATIAIYYKMRDRAIDYDAPIGKQKIPKKIWLYILSGTLLSCVFCVFLLLHTTFANMFFFIATAGLFLYFGYEISKSPKHEKLQIISCSSLILIGILYFVMFFQIFMSFPLFVERCVNRSIFNFNIPTAAFFALDPMWIIILSPILVWIYGHLGRKGKDLKITTKFALGIFLTSLFFIILAVSTHFYIQNFKISGLWIILAIGFYAIGELFISALGVAMVTKIAPKRMYGVMMGTWFLGSALASDLSGNIASLAAIPKNVHDISMTLNIYSKAFWEMGIAGILASVVAYVAGRYIWKMIEAK